MQETKFVLNCSINLEEDNKCEFKEITGRKPVDTIKNTVDEYAVAYLNSEGGNILWGIQDSERVVIGVKLNHQERDDLRKVISSKLHSIQPPIDPTAYELELHPIYNSENDIIDDLFVIAVKVPASNSLILHFTSGNEAFVKINGAKKKLTGPEIQDWIVRRYLHGNWKTARDIADVAVLYDNLMPILYWMYQSVPYSDRNYIYGKLQEFFRDLGNYSLELETHPFLHSVEVLLRVATHFWSYGNPEESPYINNKIWVAHTGFIDYFNKIGFSDYSWDKDKVNGHILDFQAHINALLSDLGKITRNYNNLSKMEASIIKFLKLVMDHLGAEWEAKEKLDIPEAVILQFQELAAPICKAYFSINIPTRDQDDIIHDFKQYCPYNHEVARRRNT